MDNRLCDRQFNKSKINNYGFSLVELIVIMVIIVILSVSAVATFVNSSGQRVSSSTNVVSNYLDNVMNYTMTGKYHNKNSDDTSEEGSDAAKAENKSAVFSIEYKNGKYYVSDGISKEEPLSSGIKITYDKDNGTNVEISDNFSLQLTFSRLNGSFNPLSDGSYVKYINITSENNSNYAKVIRLYNKTGEYEIVDAQGDEDK